VRSNDYGSAIAVGLAGEMGTEMWWAFPADNTDRIVFLLYLPANLARRAKNTTERNTREPGAIAAAFELWTMEAAYSSSRKEV
jgi:hypothetical protein